MSFELRGYLIHSDCANYPYGQLTFVKTRVLLGNRPASVLWLPALIKCLEHGKLPIRDQDNPVDTIIVAYMMRPMLYTSLVLIQYYMLGHGDIT